MEAPCSVPNLGLPGAANNAANNSSFSGAEGDGAATAIEQWISGGAGRGELISALFGLEQICARCTVCLAGVKAAECYAIPDNVLCSVLCNTLKKLSLPVPQGKGVQHHAHTGAGLDEPVRTDAQMGEAGAVDCSACLGILCEATPALADILAAKVWEMGYNPESIKLFMLSLSVPSSVLIRQHLYCKRVCTLLKDSGLPKGWKPLVLKEAFQFALAGHLSRRLGGARQDQTPAADCGGRLKIEAEYRHEESAGMKEVLLGSGNYKKSVRAKPKRGERRGQMQDVENINAVLAELNKIAADELFTKFPFPLSAAKSAPDLTVKIERESVFVGGW